MEIISLLPEELDAPLRAVLAASGETPKDWALRILSAEVKRAYWTLVCAGRLSSPKPPPLPVGRPRRGAAEREGRQSLKFFDDLWRYWREHLGERWEALAGPMYAQWERKVAEGDWEWVMRFRKAQPWQRLQDRFAGKEWPDVL